MLGPARNIANDRRVHVAIAELGADHLVAFALLDVRHGGEDVAGLLARGRIVANVRAPAGAPLTAAEGGVTRSADIALAHAAALDLVGLEQVRSTPAAQRGGKLPREIERVGHTGIHTESAGWDDQVCRVAGEK